MKTIQWLWTVCLVILLAACGGGGGDSGSSLYGAGSGTAGGSGGSNSTTDGATSSTTDSYTLTVNVQRVATSVTSITSTETVQATASVLTKAGVPVPGVVVSFAEQDATLLKFAPSSATALTGSDGVARIDLSARSADATGATTVTASSTVGTIKYASSRSIEIKAGSVGGAVQPKAINFVGSNPADRAIVIKGAGGNGRSESASLTFKVVDGSGAPINGATVNFAVNPANQVTLNIASAVSNSDGLVTTTVQAGSVATSVIVVATAAANTAISTQSDTLIVSNGSVIQAGFQVVAERYNLDGRLIGDATKVSAYARDQFGNPVPDGLAVSFTTDYGSIGSSTLGGCITVNGRCSADFRVQDPRGGGIATVIGSARVDVNTVVSDSIQLHMAGAAGGTYLAKNADGSTLNGLGLATCKQTVELLLTDGSDHAAAAGSTISVSTTSTGVGATITSGTPVLDQLATGFPGTPFVLQIDLIGSTGAKTCGLVGGKPSGSIWLMFETPNKIQYIQKVDVVFPPAPDAPMDLVASVSGQTVSLSWTDKSANETGFLLEVSRDGGASFVGVVTLVSNKTTYSYAATVAGSYVFRVSAVSDVGGNSASILSNTVSVVLP